MVPEKGYPLVATVACIKGHCNAGHKVGDQIKVSARNTAGMCGYLYHAAHPAIVMLQFGGSVPWADNPGKVVIQCPDTENLLTLEVQRITSDHCEGEQTTPDTEECSASLSKD